MKQEAKEKLVEMRLDGHSLRSIASELKCSHQIIENYLKELQYNYGYKPDPNSRIEYPQLNDAQRADIAKAIVAAEGEMAQLKTLLPYDERWLQNVMEYTLVRKPSSVRRCVYPAISDWMRRHMVTGKEMSQKLYVGPAIMSAMLTGRRPFSPDVVATLKSLTGMTTKELFAGCDEGILQATTKGKAEKEQARKPSRKKTEEATTAPAYWEPAKTVFTMPPSKKQKEGSR